MVRFLGVLREIGVEQMQGVEAGGSVEFTGVPEIGTMGKSRVEGFEVLRLRGRGGGPGQSWAVSMGSQLAMALMVGEGAYSLCHSRWHRLRGRRGRAF